MAGHLSKSRIILALALLVLLAFTFVSACSSIFGGAAPASPAALGIIAPQENAQVLVNGPVQIQSAFADPASISRVEFWVQGESDSSATLLRSDRPAENGVVLQQWRPEETGAFFVIVRAFNSDNQQLQQYTRRLIITDGNQSIVSGTQIQPELAVEIEPPTATPSPIPPVAGQAEVAQITQVATLTPTPSPTPIRRYPPPPSIPGVPPGPTQRKLPKLHPPVCDAAEYLGPFTGDTTRRVVITEDDDVAAQVVGGTIVFRGWRLRNTGTCTWGPGYELAFYGGRAMGSGGVAFEAIFPSEPGRRNAPISDQQLVVPEGKPNQTAIVEVQLLAPVIPGIHQSYWRMRNPQGVYFGPIVGVTMEVVRDCQPIPGGPTLYGSPIINRFEILGAGDVYRPFDPTNVIVEVATPVVLDYSVINANNFDIVIEDPTGSIDSRTSPNPSERVRFIPNRLGRYTVTLYADNGSCTVQARVFVDVVPREGEQFELDIILASSAPVSSSDASVSTSPDVEPGTIRATWKHFDTEVDQVAFHADLYRRERQTPFFNSCVTVPLFEDEVEVFCGWTDWQRVERTDLPIQGSGSAGTATVWNLQQGVPGLPVEIQQGQPTETATMTQEQEAQFIFCRLPEDENVQYGVKYFVEAEKNSSAAEPPRSNEVDVVCGVAEDTPTNFNP